jgi:putative endonuclease
MWTDTRQALGRDGEDLACDELRRLGYAILARRYRTRVGELDIVARDGETLVFVEVKARRSDEFGTPGEAVTWRKRRKLQSMATDFLSRGRLSAVSCRFDVVAITIGLPGERPRIEVYRAAFETA